MTKPEYDPVYLHARREAGVVMIMFAIALAWSVGNYYFVGSVESWSFLSVFGLTEAQPILTEDPRFTTPEVTTVLGMPLWVFTGILLPWLVIDVVAFWFCYYYMADDDLGTAPDESEASTTT